MTAPLRNQDQRKWLIFWNGKPAGWPTPLKFDTKKEARARAQKIAHQLRDSESVFEVVREP